MRTGVCNIHNDVQLFYCFKSTFLLSPQDPFLKRQQQHKVHSPLEIGAQETCFRLNWNDYFVYGCRNTGNQNVREFRRKEVIVHDYIRLSSNRDFSLVEEEKTNT